MNDETQKVVNMLQEMETKLDASIKERDACLSRVKKILFKSSLEKTQKLPETDDIVSLLNSFYDITKRLSDALSPTQKDQLRSGIYIASAMKKIELVLEKLAQNVFQMDVQVATIAEFLVHKKLATEEELQQICDTVVAPKVKAMQEEATKQEEPKEESRLWTPGD